MPAKKTVLKTAAATPNPVEEAAPAAAKSAGKKAKRAKENESLMKRFNIDFLAEMSSTCQLPTGDVRKVLDALRKVLLKHIRDKKTARVPNIAVLRVKTLAARSATKKVLFGVEKELRAKPERKKVMCTVMKSFSSDTC